MVKIHADFLGGAEKNHLRLKTVPKPFVYSRKFAFKELTPVVFFGFSEVRFGI